MLYMVKQRKNRIDVKFVSNKKDYLKRMLEPRNVSQKIFDNELVAILRSKVVLTLNKPAYVC